MDFGGFEESEEVSQFAIDSDGNNILVIDDNGNGDGSGEVSQIDVDESESSSSSMQNVGNIALSTKLLEEYWRTRNPSLIFRNSENTASKCWDNFQVVYFDNKKRDFVVCKTCKKFFVHGKKSGTSHLINHHCTKKLQSTDKKMPVSNTITQHFGGKVLKVSEKKLVEESQMICIARDLRPLGFTEGAGFLQLANALIQIGAKLGPVEASRVLASRFVLTNRVLPNLVQEARSHMRSELSDQLLKKNVNFTTDHWRSPIGENFMVITGHALNDAFDMKSCVIGTFHQTVAKTGENNYKFFVSKIAEAFDLPEEHVQDIIQDSFLTSDSGSDMVSGFSKTSQRLSCSCHNINLVLVNSVKKEEIWLKEVDDKVRAVAEYVKRSGLNSKLEIFVKMEMSVRWNTKLFMYQSVLEAYDKVMAHVDGISTNKKKKELAERLTITQEQKNTVNDMIRFLEVYQLATIELSARNTPTISKVAPLRTIMKEKCEKFEPELKLFEIDEIEEQNANWNALKEKVIALIDQKFHVSRVHLVAMFLDPLFKAMVKESQESKERIKRLTIEMYKEFIQDIVDEPVSTGQSSSSFVTSRVSSESSLFASFMTSRVSHQALASTIEQEVEEYSVEVTDSDCISFWKNTQKFPKLKKLAKKVLSVQASSVASESAFSTQGNIQTDERSRLTPEHVEQLLFLHYFYLEKYPTSKKK